MASARRSVCERAARRTTARLTLPAWRRASLVLALALSATCRDGVAPASDAELRIATARASSAGDLSQTLTIVLTPATIQVGGTATADASLRDASNAIISRPAVRWRSSNPAVATVEEQSGVVRGISAGLVEIRAMSGQAYGRLATQVTAAPSTGKGSGSDDFERVQLGPSWRTSSAAAGIVGARDFGMLTLGSVAADWAASEFSGDQFSEVVVANGKDPNMLLQVHVRRQSTGARYGFHYNPERSPAAWEIKYDGVPTEQTRIIASVVAAAPVAGDVIRIEAQGREITGYVNGRRLVTATDNAVSAFVKPGAAGITARPRRGSAPRLPSPIVATWRGGSLPACASVSQTPVALTDLGTGCYLSYAGGLYPNGVNALSGAHLSAGVESARRVRPLDVNGMASVTGKYVLLSIGMSNTTMEFCTDDNPPPRCETPSFMAAAAADPSVNKSSLAIVNGAMGGRTAPAWASASSPEYDRVRDSWLTPLGLSERQVQIVWVKVANRYPTVSLPSADADAYLLVQQLGEINRALKARYPNLQQVFVSSRVYGGYSEITLNPEPYAYESAFGAKWAIEAQMNEMQTGAIDARAGRLSYTSGSAAWMAWGPYLWADGTRPRSDGLMWIRSDFAPDGVHPAAAARQKVASMLLSFFKTSPATSCWFLARTTCS